jgi:threonine dehydrogenase-like Zn-dependent dehydrogenase
MQAVVFESGSISVRDDVPEPQPGERESRVDVRCAGICATDLALARGYMGFEGVPGHEFVGVAVDGPFAGQRVVGEINAGCGTCAGCRAGDPRHCPRRTVLGILGRSGAFAERLVLPTRNLHLVPDGVSNEAAVLAEPLAAAWQLTTQIEITPGMRALVAGDGRLGLLCAHVLALKGADVSVAGHHADHANLLPEGVELDIGMLDADPDPTTPPGGYDIGVEATGNPDVLARLCHRIRPRGVIILKTTCERPTSIDLAPVVVHEQALIGSRCGRFEPALALLERQRVPVEQLITARYPLSEAGAALKHAARPGALKVLLDIATA